MTHVDVQGVEVRPPEGAEDRYEDILTDDALALVAELQRELGPTREKLLAARREKQSERDGGALPDFLDGTKGIRDGEWQVAPVPGDPQDRRGEITRPTDPKKGSNTPKFGAQGLIAHFGGSNSP